MADPILELQFSAGIDEASRDELVSPTAAFTNLENVRQNKRGGASKRLGFAGLSATLIDGTTRTAGRRLLMNGDQPCVINGTNLEQWSDTADRWVSKGRVPEATCRLLEAPTIGVKANISDLAVCNGYAVISYPVTTTATGAVPTIHAAAVVDASNGAVVRSHETVRAATTTHNGTRLASYSTYVIAFTFIPGSTEIVAHYINLASASTINTGWVSIGQIANNAVSSGGYFDVASFSDRVVVAYRNTTGGTTPITLKALTIAGVSETYTPTMAATATSHSISETGTTLWLAWVEVATVKAMALTASSLSTVLGTTGTLFTGTWLGTLMKTYVVYESSTTATVYVAINGGEATEPGDQLHIMAIKTLAGAVAVDGVVGVCGNTKPQGRPFLYGSRVYMPVSSFLRNECVVCDVTADRSGVTIPMHLRPVIAPIQPEIYHDHVAVTGTGDAPNTRTATISATKLLFAFMIKRSGTTQGAVLAEYDFASAYRWKPAALNGSTFLSGGVTSVFDGHRVFEAAFLCRPPSMQVGANGAGSLTFTLGGRRYVATYEEVDADGNWHVSGVSTPSALTGNLTNNTKTVWVAPLVMTARGSTVGTTSIRVGIWATTDGGEEPYHRLAELPNNPSSVGLSYTDNTTDAVLATKALLYSTGNLPGTGAGQDHRSPPGLTYHVAYNGMLVGLAGKTLWHSSQPIDGEGQWFSPAFSKALAADGTGITVQDGSVILFSRDGVWVTAGEPPSDNAQQGGLSEPRRLAIDHGCINANSIVTTSIGTFYQSDRGIELLTRGQTNVFVGEKIQDTLANYPVVTAAVLDTIHGLVRFSLATSMTAGVVAATGRDIVFDLSLGVWISKDVKRGSLAGQASQDACMAYVEGAWRYCWFYSDGVVYYERSTNDASAHLDGSTWITKIAETPWVHLSGVHGQQFVDQVLFLAQSVTGHDLTLSLAFDYSSSYTSTKTFTAAQIAALAREWLVKEVGQTTSNAIRAKIEDATPSSGSVGTGEGGTWVALTFNAHQHQGPKRSANTHRGG